MTTRIKPSLQAKVLSQIIEELCQLLKTHPKTEILRNEHSNIESEVLLRLNTVDNLLAILGNDALQMAIDWKLQEDEDEQNRVHPQKI